MLIVLYPLRSSLKIARFSLSLSFIAQQLQQYTWLSHSSISHQSISKSSLSSSSVNISHLIETYHLAKQSVFTTDNEESLHRQHLITDNGGDKRIIALTTTDSNHQKEVTAVVDPRDVFCNNALSLQKISVYGFDYDYTLAVYTRAINQLIYDLSMNRLIQHYKYPRGLLSVSYDPKFAIRGLHYDVTNSCLLKLDSYSQIQNGTVYRGRKKLSRDDIINIYGSLSLSDAKGRGLMQLIDLFSLPWAGLLSTVVQYFDDNAITFDPLCMYQDVASSVKYVHISGEMYRAVISDLEHYVHKNNGLKEYLTRLVSNGKQLFMVTNSPFSFMNRGMCYMLGEDWRKYFSYIVVMAKKPDFFQGRAPFRSYHEEDDSLSYEKVTSLEKGKIYAGGNIAALSQQALFHDRRVLYFGDHIYTDLADPMLMLGWHTAAIVPELAREIRLQNSQEYRLNITWLYHLTLLIEKYQKFGDNDPQIRKLIDEWFDETVEVGEHVKVMFNPRFGSLFRTFTNMTFFSRRLNRLSDIYMSRLPNLLKYSDDHTFFPRRNALPHEIAMPFAALSSFAHRPFITCSN